jgi:hypothetical protein
VETPMKSLAYDFVNWAMSAVISGSGKFGLVV